MLKLGPAKGISIAQWVRPETRVFDIASKNPVTCRMEQKIEDVVELFVKMYRRVPVIDENGHVRGMLSATDVLNALGGWGEHGKIPPQKRLGIRVKKVMSQHAIHMDKNMEVPLALSMFKKHRFGAYPVLYRRALLGIVTEWDIVRQVRGKTGVRIGDIMVRKPIVAQASYSVTDIAKMLGMGGFRRLPVVNRGLLVGMITPRDILKFLFENRILPTLHEQKQPVTRIMEQHVVTIKPNEDVYEAVKIMIGQKIGGLPVIEEHQITGIVTERDIVDAVKF